MRDEYVRVKKGLSLYEAVAIYIRETVHDCEGVINAAARSLRVTPQTVTNRMGGKAYKAARRRRAG